MKRTRLLPLLLPLLLLTGCAGSDAPERPGIDGLETFTVEPEQRHTTGRVTYDRTPPAGGQHFPQWLRCAVYDEPVPAEFAVHSQEHGAVWLTYLPGQDPAPLVKLFEQRKDYVLVSPYPGQPSPFMASTWGAQLGVDKGDDPRLKEFVDTYAGGGQGGEKGADCVGLTLDEAKAEFDKANR